MRRLGVYLGALAVVAAGCGDDSAQEDAPALAFEVETTVEFERGTEPVAVAVLDGGDLLVGERLTGVVRTVDTDGELGPPVAELDVAADPDDQRGLLGLVADGTRIYAAWTRASDGHIVVAEVTAGSERLVWLGPAASRLANGGHLGRLPDGRILIGIGDLQDPDRVDDPTAANGKLLALDPAGPAGQVPAVLSDGWNNPFAFVVTRDGEVWVADNAPGDEPERIGRGDATRAERTTLPGKRAPAALVELEPDLLGLCGYLDGELTLVDIHDDHPSVDGHAASDCRTGAATLRDTRIAVTDGRSLHILTKH
jgi:hypothetical protein